MPEQFKVELIFPVERKVEHHIEASQPSIIRQVLLPQHAKKRSMSTPPLGLLRLATFTPEEVEGRKIVLSIRDDVVNQIHPQEWDKGTKPDLVGISCTTAASERAAYLTAEALRRDIQVVMGGPHTSVDTDSALETGAAVVKGPGELIWPEILHSAVNGGLKNQVYEKKESNHLGGTTLPPRSFFNAEDYFSTNILSAGEGCPYQCPFCSTKLVKGAYQGRDVKDVSAEIDQFQHDDGMVIVTDDNFFMHPNVGDIMEHLGKKGHTWYASASSKLADKKPDLIRLAGKNGCRSLFLGIDNLEGLPKNNNVDYGRLIERIRQCGMTPAIGFVLGLGDPTKEGLQEEADSIKRFITKFRIAMVHLSSSVPYPGTQEYQLKKDRINKPPSQYDTQGQVVYRPKHLSAEEFNEIYFRLCKDLYAIPNILWRLSSIPGMREKMELFFYNLSRWRHVKNNFQK